jgi:uncharacterized protein (TIGR03435 family)
MIGLENHRANSWVLFGLIFGFGASGWSQSPTTWTAPSQTANTVPGRLAFEVVSIRQKKEFSKGIPEVGPTPDGWRMVDNGLELAILQAYVPETGAAFYTDQQLSGLPAWVHQESYEIQARVSEADQADWHNPAKQPAMLRAMLQAMLADRCGLVVHRETKEVPVLALLLGKSGSKLKDASPDEPHPSGIPLPGGGLIVPEDGGRTIHIYAAPMHSFASLLSNLVKEPVQDKTGLTGKYDMVIPNLAMVAAGPPQSENGAASDPAFTMFSVVAGLGLQLEATKGEVETLEVDHIDRPSEN